MGGVSKDANQALRGETRGNTPFLLWIKKAEQKQRNSFDRFLCLDNTYCEISPVFTRTFWLSFPVWSVTFIFAERFGAPMISIFLVGDLSVL